MLNRSEAEHILSQMMRIRQLEEACAEQYANGRIRGFLHLYIGEEAVAVGVMDSLKEGDAVFATYREHGHALLKGIPAKVIMAEMFGRKEGCCRGRGGSMHLFDASRQFYGGSAIVGGALPLSVGMALAFRMLKRSGIAVCFFGEGAMAEGVFHESMNMAALWNLPVLFVCENNLYAMGTALERSESETDLVKKAESYRINASRVDGMDVLAVREAAAKAIQMVLEQGGPYFLECQTYRFRAHSMFDPELYRDKAEVARWKLRDPIELFFKHMQDLGFIDDAGLAAMRSAIADEIGAAVQFAEQGSEEPEQDLYRFIYSENQE